jgi:hypothetical protein
LLCCKCAEIDQAKQIELYTFIDKNACTIGNLLPARPTPEGDTLWGHCAGDIKWWYALPQYRDDKKEMTVAKRERDHFLACMIYAEIRWMEMLAKVRELENQIKSMKSSVEKEIELP